MPDSRSGYLFVPDEADDANGEVRAGDTLRVADAARAWVVAHAIETLDVVRWPGRLFRAEVVDNFGVEQDGPAGRHMRAAAVRIDEELPAWRVFGERGQAVAAVIAAASRVELDDVETLAAHRDPDAGRAYARSWKRWLTSLGVNVSKVGDDLDGTLAIPIQGVRSPINDGFAVLSRAFENRAEQLAGDAAFVTSDDGERWLERTWSAAACALLEAAMSFGSPAFAREDAPTLSAAWRVVVERAV